MRNAALGLLLASCSVVLVGTSFSSIADAKTAQGFVRPPAAGQFARIPKVRRLKGAGAKGRHGTGSALVQRKKIHKSFFLSSSPRRSCRNLSDGAGSSSRGEPHPFVEELDIELVDCLLFFEDARRFTLSLRRVPGAVDEGIAWLDPKRPKSVDFVRPSDARRMVRLHPKMPPPADDAPLS